MHRSLQTIADANHGTVLRGEALDVVDHVVLDRAVDSGQLVQFCPRTFVDAARTGERRALLMASARYGGADSALSHTTALEVWRLPVPVRPRIHLMIGDGRQLRGSAGLQVHRRRGFLRDQTDVVVRDGLNVTPIEPAIVDSWPLLGPDVQRAPAITAVNRRLTTPGRLVRALAGAPRLGGRGRLLRLVELLARGCRSHLELWGHEKVFTGDAFERLRWQVRISLGRRTVYLDALDPRTGVDFELDGAAYHTEREDRERDLRRDAALQARGFTVVRFSHLRLLREPGEVRREALAIMAGRGADWGWSSAG